MEEKSSHDIIHESSPHGSEKTETVAEPLAALMVQTAAPTALEILAAAAGSLSPRNMSDMSSSKSGVEHTQVTFSVTGDNAVSDSFQAPRRTTSIAVAVSVAAKNCLAQDANKE